MTAQSRPQKALFIVDDALLETPQLDAFEITGSIGYAKLRAMDAAEFAALDISAVISPPVNASYDCLDVAELLTSFGFRDLYLIVAPNLPNPRVVAQEISANHPGLKFKIIKDLQAFFATS